MGSSWTRDWTHVPCISRRILYHWTTMEVLWFIFGLHLSASHFLSFHFQSLWVIHFQSISCTEWLSFAYCFCCAYACMCACVWFVCHLFWYLPLKPGVDPGFVGPKAYKIWKNFFKKRKVMEENNQASNFSFFLFFFFLRIRKWVTTKCRKCLYKREISKLKFH